MRSKILKLFDNWFDNVRVKPKPYSTINMRTLEKAAFEAGYAAASEEQKLARYIELRDCFPHMSATWVMCDHKIDELIAPKEE